MEWYHARLLTASSRFDPGPWSQGRRGKVSRVAPGIRGQFPDGDLLAPVAQWPSTALVARQRRFDSGPGPLTSRTIVASNPLPNEVRIRRCQDDHARSAVRRLHVRAGLWSVLHVELDLARLRMCARLDFRRHLGSPCPRSSRGRAPGLYPGGCRFEAGRGPPETRSPRQHHCRRGPSRKTSSHRELYLYRGTRQPVKTLVVSVSSRRRLCPRPRHAPAGTAASSAR